MIIVLASIVDDKAAAFVEEFSDVAPVTLVTCKQLAENSTILRYPGFEDSRLTIGDRSVSVKEIAGVVNVLPAVLPDELLFYGETEREYQAAEFHALLTFLLSMLPCPVVNRPRANSLIGPGMNRIGWIHMAQRIGIPVSPIVVDTDHWEPVDEHRIDFTIEVNCIRGNIVTPSNSGADHNVMMLCRFACVDYLRAIFETRDDGSIGLLTASTLPDLSNAHVRQALVDFFLVARDSR